MEFVKLAVILSVGVGVIEGYGTGAPPGACTDLKPGHGTEQTVASPYKVEILNGATSYVPGGAAIQVKLSGTKEFQGMLLQARKAGSTTPLGTFTAPDAATNTKLTQCSSASDSVTHSSQAGKNDLTFYWNPPSSATGEIHFLATFAEAKMTWWSNIQSAKLTHSSGDTGMTTTAPSGASTSESNGETEPPASSASSTYMSVMLLASMVAYLLL